MLPGEDDSVVHVASILILIDAHCKHTAAYDPLPIASPPAEWKKEESRRHLVYTDCALIVTMK